MRRREFIVGAGAMFAAGCAPRVAVEADPAAVKQTVTDYYSAFSGFDKQRYRALLTEDYLLLENGRLVDIEGDVAMMATPETHRQRKDVFNFRSVKVQDDVAFAVYFLNSEITDDKGTRSREWLESAVLRRSGVGWQIALLHSTRITNPTGP